MDTNPMSKYLVALLVVVILGVGGFFAFNAYIYNQKQGGVEDYRKITVVIDGAPIEVGTEGMQYFGNEAKGDLNDDGIPDLAFLVTNQAGGTGTFYYVVAALQNSEGRYNGSNAILLGDRIAPQSTEIRNGILIVNYADRAPEDPFSTAPHIGVSVYIYFAENELKAEWPVKLYYYDRKLDTDETGNILCSEKGLVAVPRMIPGASVYDAIRVLIEGKLTDAEKARGITTEFPLDGLTLTRAELKGWIVMLSFDDPNNKTSGGACRATILRKQIEATAKQFEGIQEVEFVPSTVFQP